MQLDPLENSASRKRPRSNSQASDSGESSSKRAASEGPSLVSDSGLRSPNSVEPQSISQLIIEDFDIDTYMANQDDASPKPTWKQVSPSDKLSTYEKLSSIPLELGHSWYIVSIRWLRDWKMACRGQSDKQGPREEASLGSVDNSALIDAQGDLQPGLLDKTDFEVVPKPMWELFVSWYGVPAHTLERKVTTQGASQELFVECYVPRFRVYQLRADKNAALTSEKTPPTIQISLRAPLRDFLLQLGRLSNATPPNVRYWRIEGSTGTEQGFEFPVSRLGSPVDPLVLEEANMDKSLADLYVNPTDEFIIELKENGKWIYDPEEKISPEVVAPLKPGPVFGSNGGFFGEVSQRLGISSTSSKPNGYNVASTSALQPALNIVSSGKTRTSGTLGLSNLGNTCFMNSALQCLAHNEELTEYFLTDLYREELNRDNPLGMGGAIADNFGALLRQIWSPAPGSLSYSPREFKLQLQRFAPQFSGYQQHDSQELVAFLLDGLHEDLNRVLKKPYVENPDWQGGGNKELAEHARRSWRGYISRNDSAIVDLFQGQYQSTLVCPECQKVSITFDPFMYLTLPLPIKKKWRHDIYFIPWDAEKPHLRIPVEVDYDSSFKELRRLLGRWTDSNPEHLITLEVFQHRFYKYLDDSTAVSDMAMNDTVVCFEMPCKTYMNERHHEFSGDDRLILPVYSSPIKTRGYSSQPDLMGNPFLVALTLDEARSLDSIYVAIVDRLRRWSRNASSLYRYAGVDHISGSHIVSIMNGSTVDTSITEIRENGDVIVTNTHQDEESDIADMKSIDVVEEDIDTDMVEVDSAPVPLGPQTDLFNVQMCHFPSTRASMESGAYAKQPIAWEERERHRNEPLVKPGDILYCRWDDSMQSFFLDEHALWEKKHFQEFLHPEYEALRKQAEKKHNELSIQDCLDEFTKEEQLGEDDPWYCPQCKKHQQATKNLQIWKAPDVLVVHLKRFSNSRIMRDKIDAFIDFPLEGLNLEDRVGERRSAKALADEGRDPTEFGLGDVNEPLLYDLFAVDEHIGGLGGGHYRAYAKNHVDEHWYHFDDTHVTQCKATDAINRNAYLLFYRRRTSRPIGGKTHLKIQAARQTNLDRNNVLPTPPDESLPMPLNLPTPSDNSNDDMALVGGGGPWTTSSLPFGSISSPSSSPPALLEEREGPPGLFDNTPFDPLEQSNMRYTMPGGLEAFQGRTGSPVSSSSNEAVDDGSDFDGSPQRYTKFSEYGTSPSPQFATAVLKPASFGPSDDDLSSSWEKVQDPPSPLSRAMSEPTDPRATAELHGVQPRKTHIAQLPSPEPEGINP
ncbi:ubiquitin-specific protease [Hysterangium stoloniferum]|nr:ubiquitin-specific protease [Hysterangium stoloniferum]